MDSAPTIVHDLGITPEDELEVVRNQRNDILNQVTHLQIVNHKLRNLVDKLSAEIEQKAEDTEVKAA